MCENAGGEEFLSAYDAVIIGAGHNGLVCACYLARAGKQVIVVEAAETAGGLAAAREFHPGFRAPIAHSFGGLAAGISSDLRLAGHGYRPGPESLPLVALRENGPPVVLADGRCEGPGAEDQASFARLESLLQAFADALEPFWFDRFPAIGAAGFGDRLTFAKLALRLRRLGKARLREFLRIVALPARDLTDEFFDDELLKVTVAWDALIGSKMAPRSPNNAVLMLLYRMAGRAPWRHGLPTAGAANLIEALTSSAAASGAQLRLGSAVDRILVDTSGHQQVRGVRLADGTEIAAGLVVSSADPKTTFLHLLGVEHLDIGFTNRIRRLRADGLVGKLHLALEGRPEFDGLVNPRGRILIAPTLDALEFAFDAAKYGEIPEAPVLEVAVPTIGDPALAPDGAHVLSAHVMYVPGKVSGGWDGVARDQMKNRCLDVIEAHSPGIRQELVHAEFLAPADIEGEFRVSGGHWHHGEFALDQMLNMRPTYDAAQYRTPVDGLYLCGAGCHPAGDLTGIPGYNAARAILR